MVRPLSDSDSSRQGDTLAPDAFTDLYIAYLRKTLPGIRIERCDALDLKVHMSDEATHSVFLENAYTQYLASPDKRDQVIETYIDSFVEVAHQSELRVDPDRIVPVIKDRAWLAGILESLRERSPDDRDIPAYVSDAYNSELTVFYAEDSPRNIRYLTEDAIEQLGIDRDQLLSHAIGNLMRLIDGYQVMGGEGIYLITAGGDYEASLLLVDEVWDRESMPVDGDFVVSIPARDLLIVTGSRNHEAIERLRLAAAESSGTLSYTLTPVLFIRKGGIFEVFEG